MRKFLALACVALALGAGVQSLARAAETIHVVVPFPPGGPLDSLARLVSQKLHEQTGDSYIVENRAGANGIIGAKYAAKQSADGKTLLFSDGGLMTVNPYLYPKDANFDPRRDLKVVCGLVSLSAVLVANPKLGIKTLKEFVERARQTPFTYASGGIGSTGHLTMAYFSHELGLKLVHVPYKGASPAMSDLVGGQVQTSFSVVGGALPFIKQGSLIALAVSGAHRVSSLPDVPTISETLLPGFDVRARYYLMVPARTPVAAVQALEKASQQVMKDPAVAAKLENLGMEASYLNSGQAAQVIESESQRWSKLIRQEGIKIQ